MRTRPLLFALAVVWVICMVTGPQAKFCEGIATGLNGTEAYLAAYPRSTRRAAEPGASRLLRNAKVKAEIAKLRAEAAKVAGSAVLTLAEKRIFLAQVVRACVATLPHDSPLWVSVKKGKDGTEYRLPDKIAAIKLDNDLAGEGSEAGANDALGELLGRVLG